MWLVQKGCEFDSRFGLSNSFSAPSPSFCITARCNHSSRAPHETQRRHSIYPIFSREPPIQTPPPLIHRIRRSIRHVSLPFRTEIATSTPHHYISHNKAEPTDSIATSTIDSNQPSAIPILWFSFSYSCLHQVVKRCCAPFLHKRTIQSVA